MEVEPKLYRKSLIISCMIPMMILVPVGLTSSFIHEYHYSVYIQIADDTQIQDLLDQLALIKLTSLSLVVIGILLTFLILAKKSQELKMLRMNINPRNGSEGTTTTPTTKSQSNSD